jgi:ribosome-interacting GTPase 1
MPTNLPPEYFDAEKRYKEAESIGEKIACLEEMLSKIPKHKGTDKLRADYRRRLSKLKSSAKTQKRSGGHHSAYQIEKEGAGRVVVIGPTNVGKSSLVDQLTNASPEVSIAPYSTWRPTPGMMLVNNIQVQLIDTPPIDREFVEAELFDLIRRADLILLLVDVQTYPVQQLEETIASLREHRIAPRSIRADTPLEDRFTYVPLIVVANKCDDTDCDEVFELFFEMVEGEWQLIPVSVATDRNFDILKKTVVKQLGVIRVYSKAPNKEADLTAPFVLKKGSTVEEFAGKIHQDFYKNLKSARVWGSSAFDGQMVQRDYVLQDGDIIELRI